MSDRPRRHIDPSTLLELAEGNALRSGPRRHLASCRRCGDLAEEIATLVRDLRSLPAAEPAPQLLARLEEAFPSPRRRGAAVVEVQAKRVAIRGPQAAELAGVRGRAEHLTRLRFRGAGLDVDLEVQSRGRQFAVRGLALAEAGGWLPIVARAEVAGAVIAESPVGAHGLFRLERIPRARIDVVLDLGSLRLRAGPIDPAGESKR